MQHVLFQTTDCMYVLCINLTINSNYFSVDKNQLDVNFVFFISLLIVAQHVSGNHVPIIRN